MAAVVVKRWDNVRDGNGKVPKGISFVQLDDGNFRWDSPQRAYQAEPLNVWLRTGLPDVIACINGTLPPTWEAGKGNIDGIAPGWENWPNDPVVGAASSSPDRCKYGLMPIAGVSEVWSPYVVKDFNGWAQTVQRFSAPIEQQERESTDRVIRAALRTLREVPLCNVTGQPVNVIAMPRNLTMQAYFKCENCK